MTTRKHEVPDELLSSLLSNYKKPEDLIGENGLLKQLTKLLVERAHEVICEQNSRSSQANWAEASSA